MTLRLVRRIAIALIAFHAFAQASVALAACGMERGAMAQAMTMPGGQPCNDCAQAAQDSVTTICVAHCTADLQLTAQAHDFVTDATVEAVAPLIVPRFTSPPVIACLPPGGVPRRILLHSFQV